MKPIQQGDEYVIEWNGYKAVAPTETLCIRVFEEMLMENARLAVTTKREIEANKAHSEILRKAAEERMTWHERMMKAYEQ